MRYPITAYAAAREVVCTILANRYRVLKTLGRGGMSSVYLVRDLKLNVRWAVKELKISDGISAEAKRAEISVLRKVSHPNLPRITDVFEENGRQWLVMDYIEGDPLDKLLLSGKKLPSKSLYRWSLEIASALSYLHSLKPPVIYRDLKPANLIVRPSGSIVLIDFGAAKSFRKENDRYALGTKRYAAPEQYRGVSDVRSDIYALGRTIEAMAGSGASFTLRAIIRKCTRTDPARRYRSAEAVKRALVFSRDLYRILMLGAFGVVLLLLAILKVKTVVSGSEKQIEQQLLKQREEIEENAELERVRGLYTDALMCFYELKDYEAALGYFRQIPEERIPEAGYYISFCEQLISREMDRKELYRMLKEFRRFNDETIKASDTARKVRNDINIAQIYLTYGDEDAGALSEAKEILQRVLADCRNGEASAQTWKTALPMLSSVQKALGRLKPGDRESCYLKAIACNREYTELPLAREEPEQIRLRYCDSARLFEELGMIGNALRIYEQSEAEYPGEGVEIYLGHLKLLLRYPPKESNLTEVFEEAAEVKGMEQSSEFRKIRERLKKEGKIEENKGTIKEEGYEKKKDDR